MKKAAALLAAALLTTSCNAVASGVELDNWNDLCQGAVAEADASLGGRADAPSKRAAWAQCMQSQGAECVPVSERDTYTCRSTTGATSMQMDAPY